MNIDAAYKNLTAISSEIGAALAAGGSEQDARLKIINRVLTSILGWRYDQIKTEVSNEKGFADYALRDTMTGPCASSRQKKQAG
jgi:hypothetical protein